MDGCAFLFKGLGYDRVVVFFYIKPYRRKSYMLNRMFKRVATTGAVLALWANAQTCNETMLYDGSSMNGKMDEASRSFPEAPEWQTNWGNQDGMIPPYIRLSGQKSVKSDWKGSLDFNGLPLNVSGGNLKVKVRTTQNAKLGFWLVTDAGNSKTVYRTISANATNSLEIPLSELQGSGTVSVKKIGVGIFNIPAYQYTTLFIDDVSFTCVAKAGAAANEIANDATNSTSGDYTFTDVTPASPERLVLTGGEPVAEASKKLSQSSRDELKKRTSANFVLTETEHKQILKFQDMVSRTPKASREGWYKSMFLVNSNRLRDSVIANPKNLYLDAGAMAAGYDNRVIPILVADLDYAYKVCTDTSCSGTELKDYSLLLAGLPVTHVQGSKIKFVYDPNFVATTRSELPTMEICAETTCKQIAPKGSADIEFESAGTKTISIKLSSKKTNIQQKLFVEVK